MVVEVLKDPGMVDVNESSCRTGLATGKPDKRGFAERYSVWSPERDRYVQERSLRSRERERERERERDRYVQEKERERERPPLKSVSGTSWR